MISALFLFVLVSLASANLERVNTVLHKETPTILPWVTPMSARPETLHHIVVVEDADLTPIATALSQRGHQVSWASFGAGTTDFRAVQLNQPEASSARFGVNFDRALATYESLKNIDADYLVFSSVSGLAYFCQEAKKSGIAFQSTQIVIEAHRFEVLVGSHTYQDMITSFMAMRSLELADIAFAGSSEKLDDVKFRSNVNIWQVADMSHTVSVIESMTAHPSPIAVETPLVSVIVTAFNRPALLKQAVLSLQTQTYKNLEIVVVDDGSTEEGMAEALKELEAAQGVSVVRQSNQYLGAARNNGAKVAKGSLLVFLDDDNVALPTMIETLVTAIEHADAQVAVNAHYGWNGKVSDPIPTDFTGLKMWCPVGPAVAAGIKGNVFGNANFMIQKESFFALSGFTEDRTGWEDHEFHAKASITGMEYVVVPEPLMLYRFHDVANQMFFNTDNTENVKRVERAYTDLLAQANVEHDFSERTATECAITLVGFADTTNTPPLCETLEIRFTIVDTGGTGYTTQSTNPRVSVVPPSPAATIPIPAANVNCQQQTASGERVPWICTLQGVRNNATLAGSFVSGGDYRVAVEFDVTVPTTRTIQCTPNPAPANEECQIPSVCFHESTRVTYNNQELAMADFESHDECVIPHKVVADGVSIATTCGAEPLRLTNTHLVFTKRGLVKAAEVQKDDVVFSDLNQQTQCTVLSVTQEKNEKYFGLNCLKSVVLANGIKASTFGDLHTVPSMWMSWVGSVAGVERASRWGVAIESLARKWRVL